jgi:predicted transcriptional regulator
VRKEGTYLIGYGVGVIGMPSTMTREAQLKAWEDVRRLASYDTFSHKEIAHELGLNVQTVKKYIASDEPPSTIGGHRRQHKPINISFPSREAVPEDIASLRDRLVAALQAGHDDEYGRLVQALKRHMQNLKLGVKSVEPEEELPLAAE